MRIETERKGIIDSYKSSKKKFDYLYSFYHIKHLIFARYSITYKVIYKQISYICMFNFSIKAKSV